MNAQMKELALEKKNKKSTNKNRRLKLFLIFAGVCIINIIDII